MAVSVHSADADENDLNTTINTTPLVDVMLVMLIIFLITVPVIVKVVPVTLPNARNIATQTKPDNIVIAVDKDENVYWNNAPIPQSELRGRLDQALRAAIAAGKPPPEVHIRGDRDVRFEAIGKVVLAIQQSGIPKVAFLLEPRNEEEQ
ncbi:MAG TPA: biopolymer transporter ExbD [Rhizomicrobium sp.]|nr:biopolymer transporter ExbD [Rhizomicrobium sp.]